MPKTNYTVLYLKDFKGGLHLARGLNNAYDTTLKTLHSDTLKSALFVCALQLYGSEQITEDFFEKFTLSSAFPFYEQRDGQRLYFFPKPEIPKLNFKIEGEENGLDKKLKKVRFFEKALLEDFLNDAEKPQIFDTNDFSGTYIGKAGSGLKNLLPEKLMTTEPYQHVQIPRNEDADSTPYYVDKIFFHKNAGLFCLVELTEKGDEKTLKMVKAAFNLLADNGIGTDRNTGNGQFSADFGTLELNTPDDANFDLALSLYLPEEAEIKGKLQESFYGITKRGGYISSPEDENNLTIRKRSIFMFTEGSFFPKMENRTGKIENLKSDYALVKHEIWRDGRALFVPMKY